MFRSNDQIEDVFKNADTQPVLNLAPVDMQIYNNGFKERFLRLIDCIAQV